MRKLEFRAWIRKDKKMVGVKLMGGGYLWTDENWIDSMRANLEDTAHEIGVTCDVMQFTGLYAKNKKAIYEGDICLFENIGKVKIIWGYSAWHGNNDRLSPQDYNIPNYTMIEVIGNIHETPGLLDRKEN